MYECFLKMLEILILLNQDPWSQGLGSLGIKWEVFKVKYKKIKVINVTGHLDEQCFKI